MFLKGKKQYHKYIMSVSYQSYGFHLYLGLASLNSDNLTTLGPIQRNLQAIVNVVLNLK